ncbi:MAG: cupin domain-containing protein [Candidatus Aegiribacteria sp.]|nr:cupin domain-containing protein [Candidatus Aegiribacteria sp.]
MNIIRVSEQPVSGNPHGIDVRRVYDSEHALSSHLTLKPGEKLIRHITPVDVFFYVLEGTGIIEVGNEVTEVSADTVIDSPKDIPHCWYNRSDGDLRILVVKVPRPSTGTKLL